jgi:hypothetical protein
MAREHADKAIERNTKDHDKKAYPRKFLEALSFQERNILLTGDPFFEFDPCTYVLVYSYPNQVQNYPAIPRKKTIETPYSTLVSTTHQMVHKEVSLPTHIESKLEEIDSEGFSIEYIKLSVFEVGQATYFRDSSKNKLYKKIKEKGIGNYVGRWNPDTESIITDIPDSDEE